MSIFAGGTKIKDVYLGGNKLKEIYVGGTKVRPTGGLLGYRPLQSDLKDASGNGKDASWFSGTGSFETANGYKGARCTTNLSGDNVSTQHVVTPINYVGKDLSYAGWINFYAKNGNKRPGFISLSGSGNTAYIYSGLRVSLNYRFTMANNIAGSGWLDYNTLNTNTWYFISVVYDNSAGKTKLYINGNKATETTGYVGVDASTNFVWRLGCGPYDGNPIAGWGGTNGLIRHYAIWDKALTDAEVLEFYNQTK